MEADPQMMQVLTRTNTLLETLTNRLGVPGYAQANGLGMQPGSVYNPVVTAASAAGQMPGAIAGLASMVFPGMLPMVQGPNFAPAQFTQSQQVMRMEAEMRTAQFGRLLGPSLGGLASGILNAVGMVMPDVANQVHAFGSMFMPKWMTPEATGQFTSLASEIPTTFSARAMAEQGKAISTFFNKNIDNLRGSAAEIGVAMRMRQRAGLDPLDVTGINNDVAGLVNLRNLGLPAQAVLSSADPYGTRRSLEGLTATGLANGFSLGMLGNIASTLGQAYGNLGTGASLAGGVMAGTRGSIFAEQLASEGMAVAAAGASGNTMQVLSAAYVSDPAMADAMLAAVNSGNTDEFRKLEQRFRAGAGGNLIGSVNSRAMKAKTNLAAAAGNDIARSLGDEFGRAGAGIASRINSMGMDEVLAIANGESGSLAQFGTLNGSQANAIVQAATMRRMALAQNASEDDVAQLRAQNAEAAPLGNGAENVVRDLLVKLVDVLTNFTPDKLMAFFADAVNQLKTLGGTPVGVSLQ